MMIMMIIETGRGGVAEGIATAGIATAAAREKGAFLLVILRQ